MKNINNYLIALLVMGLISCGSEEYSKTTGGVTARAVWPDERTVSQSVSAAVMPPSIKTVRMIVSGPGMKDVQDDFPAAAGKGTVHEIPAGADRTVTFHGLDADSILTYEGNKSGLTVTSGETTDAGYVEMELVTPPDLPFNVKAVAGNKEVTITWNSVTGATSYNVYRDIVTGVSKGNYIDKINTSTIPYKWTGTENDAPLENGTKYYFVVTAVNSYGESDESEEVSATPTNTPPCLDNDGDLYGEGDECLDDDCDDNDENIHPGAKEICDGKNNDCNSATADGSDESWYNTKCDGNDSDECEEGQFQCTNGSQTCSDNTESNVEVCDGNDNDCDGVPDGGEDLSQTCGFNNKGECSLGTETCNDSGIWVGCDAVYPTTEICDGLDSDCDGHVNDCDIVGLWTLYEDRLCDSSPEFSYDMNIDNDGTYEANGAYNTDDMSSYYRMDNFTDSIGGPAASCTTCPSAVNGYMGGAMDFSGVAAKVNVADVNQFDWAANTSFSIEFWMKKDSACSLANEVIVGRDDSASDLHWWIGINCTLPDDKLTKRTLQFILIDKNKVRLDVGGKTVLTDGNWHHVVAVRDGDNSENIIYVDGERENSDAKSFSTGFDSDTAPLNIGWLNLPGGYYYAGHLDELAIYNRNLSEDEIRLHYQFDPKLIGPWTVAGNQVTLTYSDTKGDRVYTGTVTGNLMVGTKVDYDGSKRCWYAEKR